MNRFNRGLLCLAMLGAASSAFGRLGGVTNVQQMLSSADIVIKGEIAGTRAIGPATFSESEEKRNPTKRYLKNVGAEKAIAEVKVARVLKGDVRPGSTIAVTFYSVANDESVGHLKSGEHFLLFLKREGEQYALVGVDDGKLPASKRTEAAAPSSDSQANLTGEFQLMTTESDTATALAGLNGLAQLHTPSARATLKAFTKDKRPLFRATAISGLVALGDDAAISQMFSELNSSEMNTESLSGQELEEARGDFSASIYYLGDTKNRKFANDLIRLTHHKDQYIRQAALQALRQIKPVQAIPTFLGLLDSSDQKLQYMGVISLCEIARPDRRDCPSAVLFARNRQKYVNEWKAWGNQYRP